MLCDCCDIPIEGTYYEGVDKYNGTNNVCYKCAIKYPWYTLVRKSTEDEDEDTVIMDEDRPSYWDGWDFIVY